MKQNLKTKTLFDKIWLNHLVHKQEDGTSLIYIDRHLVHEVTSPQAFEGLRNSNRKVRMCLLRIGRRELKMKIVVYK